VLDKKEALRGEQLVRMWLRQLAAAAMDTPVTGYLVARDAIVTMAPMEPAKARAQLAAIVALWRANLDEPLAIACKSALALLKGADARQVYEGGFELSGEVDDLCLARLWPDFASLSASAGFYSNAQALYGPLAAWLDEDCTVEPL
jgi:exodeoxyribonuclease V gamma subunit